MSTPFMSLMLTPDVQAAQARQFGRSRPRPGVTAPEPLSAAETAFIAGRDSFYMATVNQDGWPYIQHRGGPKGFLKVLGPTTLGFADRRGNQQLLTTGNLAHDGRVCLFLMDYPQRARLKLLGRAEILHVEAEDAGEFGEVVDIATGGEQSEHIALADRLGLAVVEAVGAHVGLFILAERLAVQGAVEGKAHLVQRVTALSHRPVERCGTEDC